MFHAAPLNCGVGNCWMGNWANLASAKVRQIFAGHQPPYPPSGVPPRLLSDSWVVPFCLLEKIPTAIAYCGMAPMKNADWAVFVVPVLPMIGRPSLIAAAV